MNIWLSIGIYNMLEAGVILIAYNTIFNTAFGSIKDNWKWYLKHSYLLGFLFLGVQSLTLLMQDSKLAFILLVYNLFYPILIMPIIFLLYIKKIRINQNILTKDILNSFTIILLYLSTFLIINSFFKHSIVFHDSLLKELYSNFSLRGIQLLMIYLYSFIKKRSNENEIFKRIIN